MQYDETGVRPRERRADDAEPCDRGRYLTPRLYPRAPFDPWLELPVPARLAPAV